MAAEASASAALPARSRSAPSLALRRHSGVLLVALTVATVIGNATVYSGPADGTLTPLITGFTPVSGNPGTLVIVGGSNLLGVISIEFGDVAAPVYGALEDGTAVQTQVPAEALSGPITVVTPHGTTTSQSDFQVVGLKPPIITSFSPNSGRPGTEVSFQGSDLVHVTGVNFNGAAAPFSTFVGLTAIVPTNATTGPITVATKQGSFTTTEQFTVASAGPPIITGFSPSNGPPGTIVSVAGSNFEQLVSVLFADVQSESTTLMGDQLWAEVPAGAATGPITVRTEGGVSESAEMFVVTSPPIPVITSFAPSSARPGDYVLLHGENLSPVLRVTVHDVPAEVSVLGPGELSITVPYAPSGPVAVQTAGGTALAAQPLTVIGGPPAPDLKSFTPTNGLGGMLITLHGANLGVVQAVLFNDVEAEFSRESDDVFAIVPLYARSGPITVKTSLGTAVTTSEFFTYNSGEVGVASIGKPNPAKSSEPVTFSVLITNLALFPLSHVVLTNSFGSGTDSSGDILSWSAGRPAFSQLAPGQIDILEARSSQGICVITNGQVLCELGSLPVLSSIEVTLVVVPRGPRQFHLLSLAAGQRPDEGEATGGALQSILVAGIVPLNLRSVGVDQVELSWPESSPALVLQSADAALVTAEWKDVLEPVGIVDGQSVVIVPIRTGCQFFRLVERTQ